MKKVNRKKILALGGMILLMGSAFVFFNQGHCSTPNTCKEMGSITGGTGSILPYTDAELQAVQSRGDKIGLYFEANWCGNCKLVKEELMAKGIPAGSTLLILDFDQRRDLRLEYGVKNVHTLVLIDQEGKQLAQDSSGEYERIIQLLD